MTTLSVPDYAVFLSSVVISLAVGVFFGVRRRGRTQDDGSPAAGFYSSQRLQVLPTALSLTVSNFSSIALLGVPVEVYFHGASVVVLTLVPMLSSLFGFELFSKPIYAMKLNTSNKVSSIMYIDDKR